MKLKRSITFILLFIFILTGNNFAETKNIGNDEIKRLMSLGIPLIDVRRKDEWVSTGVIENSYHHTFSKKMELTISKDLLTKLKILQTLKRESFFFVEQAEALLQSRKR